MAVIEQKGAAHMESIRIELPLQLAGELHRLVEKGWFQSEEEAIRLALIEFIRRDQFALIERFQREDISWALSQKPSPGPQG
ncbi:MAG: CopG family transcriptional regulator [Acidobacteria bacterium]|nr:CopG family transcriptional regulator [Acidobacteriota bacterium]